MDVGPALCFENDGNIRSTPAVRLVDLPRCVHRLKLGKINESIVDFLLFTFEP